ncbi:PREDICTED: uncharacterized protein LOC107192893 isoform X2 [Dufourea novaeangliae]|uniref:uncharacterized protein LOC107192893 isoform X2 n=1 Tax=Dufourea novaeangliae TaxID=178035 RepID=UPI000767329C|nr:PREDICTED: uncharacterized protein LOC107192893 isoform X2 [Dufourea novaeangliae]
MLPVQIVRSNLLHDFCQFFFRRYSNSIVFMEYFLQGQFIWGCFALSFTILPAAVIQTFSLRWYHSDGSIKAIHWLLHFLFLGVLHRYLILLYATIYSLRNKRFVKDKNWVYRQESDICMLHLFESFMGAAPQLILQLYVMAVLRRIPLWTSLSAVVSFCSLCWAVGAYTKAMHKINPDHEATWSALALQGLWRAGMLISRISVLVLTAICLREWFLLFLGLHWLFMTIWVILQNTDFCPTVWEERIYNCIIGLIYCFDFFNLRVGKSRYRILVFYFIVMTENVSSLVVYVVCYRDTITGEEIAITTSLVVGGMTIGLSSMLLYYGKFHPSKVDGVAPKDTNNRSEMVAKTAVTPRSFKQYYANSACSADHSRAASSEEVTTDKQSLLTNIVQSSECADTTGIINQTCRLENESNTAVCVVAERDSAHSSYSKDEGAASSGLSKALFCPSDTVGREHDIENDDATEEAIHRQKRRGICLPTAHNFDIDASTKDHPRSANSCRPIASQKRRPICISTQLVIEMENTRNEKVALDGDSDVGAKLEDLENRSPVGEGRENDVNSGTTVLRDRLKTPPIFETHDKNDFSTTEKLTKELQQRDETMSCVTSIHDYENVCPLGVARPPWCIRSWKGYTDIETYIHDDSVVRDRRRDTLTSTTTGTTYSSEFSDVTCASSILRGILKQDDYLDTLTYDLIEPRESRQHHNENDEKRSSEADEPNAATLYIAKPVVIDDKGGMFALDTILEEHDEASPPTVEKFEYGRPVRDSVSTLVNTIDQIRKYTADNSPRHVYHTTGTQWEDFDPKNLIRKAQLTRALFNNDLKDPATRNRNYINRLDESDSIVRGKCEVDAIRKLVKYCAIESIKKTPLIDAILSDSPILGNKTKPQKQDSVAYREDESDSKEHDLYVEMSPLVPVENVKVVHNNLSESVVVSSSVISTDHASIGRGDAVPNISTGSIKADSDDAERTEQSSEKRRKTINYPRRKFSLLKEKFETKSQLVYVVTPNNAIKIGQSAISSELDTSKKNVSVLLKKTTDVSTRHDKENLAPAASLNVAHATITANDGSHTNRETIQENEKSLCNTDLNLKERRHIFLEQVLSPPKLLTWNKRKSLVGSAVKKF